MDLEQEVDPLVEGALRFIRHINVDVRARLEEVTTLINGAVNDAVDNRLELSNREFEQVLKEHTLLAYLGDNELSILLTLEIELRLNVLEGDLAVGAVNVLQASLDDIVTQPLNQCERAVLLEHSGIGIHNVLFKWHQES